MTFVFSEIVVIVATLLFIVFSVVTIYRYESNFLTKQISFSNSRFDIAWSIITDISKFNNWWKDFTNIDKQNASIEVKLLEIVPNTRLKLYIKHEKKHPMIWTFYANDIGKNTILTIKIQPLTNNIFVFLLDKLIMNRIVMFNFTKSLHNYINSYATNTKVKKQANKYIAKAK